MKGFKTIFAGVGVSILGLLETFNVTDFAAYIPDHYEPLVITGVGFLIVVLRFFTTTPVGKKTDA